MAGMTARGTNPYAPPQQEAEAPPHAPGDTITCTVVLEVDDMRAGLALNSTAVRRFMPAWLALMGFITGLSAPPAWLIGQTVGFGLFGWMIVAAGAWVNAQRSIASKSESERTLTYAISRAGVEITSALTYSRVQWPAVHRFGEGPKVFVLHLSEALVQVIPKRALRAADIEALRTMFKTYVTPRKRRAGAGIVLAVLWMMLILMFLAVWQFLNSDVVPNRR
jgi:hypothetical protein